jgi:hypothetical protein
MNQKSSQDIPEIQRIIEGRASGHKTRREQNQNYENYLFHCF